METPKIIWSPKAKKQYSEVLLFWAENNNFNKDNDNADNQHRSYDRACGVWL